MNPQVEIKIILQTDGSIQVQGPLENKLVCLGILEFAKKTIIEYQPGRGQHSEIMLPNGGRLPPFPTGQMR